MKRWLWVPFLIVGCAGSFAPSRRPDGGWHLKCGPSLAKCTQQADDLCKGRGYVVISGFSKRKLYGAELGVSQVEERQAELDVACADKRNDLPNVTPAPTASTWKLPPRTEPAAPEPVAPPPPAPVIGLGPAAPPPTASLAPAAPAPPAPPPATPTPVPNTPPGLPQK